jgi:hypothetical protein
MPVRRSSTRPTLAPILARCHVKSQKVTIVNVEQQRGEEDYMQFPVSWTCRSAGMRSEGVR